MYLHSPYDMHEPLDRRWKRATYLVETGRWLSPRHDDAWIQQAVAYLRALRVCQDTNDRAAVAKRMPVIAQAHVLFQTETSLLRWAVEARILAGEAFDDIETKCALAPGVAETYEDLFFAVSDKLHAEAWIACQVIGMKGYVGLSERDLDVWWKMVGFCLGPLALDLLIGGMARKLPETLPELEAALEHQTRARLELKTLHAIHLLPVTPDTALDVLRLGVEMGIVGSTSQAQDSSSFHAMWDAALQRSMMTSPRPAKREEARLPLRLAPPAEMEKVGGPALPKAM